MTERWKLNHLPWARSELYDLRHDPGETINRIDDKRCKAVVEALMRTLTRHPAVH